jgi:hypothetical protein
MLAYKARNFTDDQKELDARKKEREEELKKIEKFVKKHGVQKTRRGKGGRGEAAEDLDYDDDDFDPDDLDLDEEEVMERPVKKMLKAVTKSKTKEVMRTVGKPFGADGRTFDLYAEAVPDEVKSVAQLIKWIRSEGRPIIEYKDGELRAYERERVTSTGRVAKVCVKKQGERNLVTYRSNKNSRRG